MIPKKNRLSRSQLQYILKKGQRQRSNHFNITWKRGATKENRFCVVVSKKIAPKATDRNHLRRQIYESIRLSPEIEPPLDIVLIAKPGIQEIPFDELQKNILSILQKLHEEK